MRGGKSTFAVMFGRALRRHREAQHLTQEALAERAEIHPTHVGLLERGQRNASLNVALRVARALGTTLAALIGEVEREWTKLHPVPSPRRTR